VEILLAIAGGFGYWLKSCIDRHSADCVRVPLFPAGRRSYVLLTGSISGGAPVLLTGSVPGGAPVLLTGSISGGAPSCTVLIL
jgi:hypothetical protein